MPLASALGRFQLDRNAQDFGCGDLVIQLFHVRIQTNLAEITIEFLTVQKTFTWKLGHGSCVTVGHH